MPTGYTAKLAEEEQSVADFIRLIGRGMGFLVMMRDAPFDAPLPDKFEAHSHRFDELNRLKEEKRRLTNLAGEELEAACAQYYDERDRETEKMRVRKEAQLDRYERMLESVQAWDPSHPVMRGTRDFAISQLKESIQFDCAGFSFEKAERKPPEEWLAEQYESTVRSIKYYTKQQAEDELRTSERNEALQVFKEELAKLGGES